jgi:uncharacterized damage-inducible protein DinB
MKSGIQFEELLAYTEEENRRWKEFFTQNPEALDLPLDVAGSVRELVRHIFAVEIFFANKVTGEKINPDELPSATLDQIFGISEKAARIYRDFFARAKPEDWSEMIELSRVNRKASRRKMVAQALTHSIRHWAQIATFLRQQGLKQEWSHDFLMSNVMK